jgi:hypothetical protein
MGTERWMARVTRREFVAFTSAVLAAALTGCSTIRGALRLYPARYDRDEELVDATLRAFVTTVIPGAPADDENLVRAFSDPYYPFVEHRGFLVFDLAERARRLAGDGRFDRLPLPARTAVLQDGLASEDAVQRLYRGAIFLAQASFYGGIYDPKGCPFIDFPGANRGYPPEVAFHPNPAPHLAAEATRDGNHA